MYYFVDSGPKFTGLALPNAGGIVLDDMSFRFWISWDVQGVFAIKVGSWAKSAHILPRVKFFNWGPRIFGLALYSWRRYRSCGKVSWRDRPRELGDTVAKKTSVVKHKAFLNYSSGRPNDFTDNFITQIADSWSRQLSCVAFIRQHVSEAGWGYGVHCTLIVCVHATCSRGRPTRLAVTRDTEWNRWKKLEIWGRAQLEAARRLESDWKYNLRC